MTGPPDALVITCPEWTPEGFQWAATAIAHEAERYGATVTPIRLNRTARIMLAARRFIARMKGHR